MSHTHPVTVTAALVGVCLRLKRPACQCQMRYVAIDVESVPQPSVLSAFTVSPMPVADTDEDVIVVDDIDEDNNDNDNDAFQPSHRAATSHAPQRSLPPRASRAAANLRRQSTPPYIDPSEGRTTRSTARGPKPQPKLKLKLSEKAAAQAPGMSFLGPYDRELDSDDEDLVFEEQFILRLPPGEDCDKLRKMAQAREISDDVWFKFKGEFPCPTGTPDSLNVWEDSRRAIFHIGNSTYQSKLVDLPCLIESQKTLDNKQMFKVADICQVRFSPSAPPPLHIELPVVMPDACCRGQDPR